MLSLWVSISGSADFALSGCRVLMSEPSSFAFYMTHWPVDAETLLDPPSKDSIILWCVRYLVARNDKLVERSVCRCSLQESVITCIFACIHACIRFNCFVFDKSVNCLRVSEFVL